MAGFFPAETLEQIRQANDIVETIGAVVPLKRAGANFVALCPFHKENTPSFSVNPRQQFFYCFGCHKGGDVFAFIREYEGLSFGEAVKRLAEKARIPLEFGDERGADREKRFLKDTLLQIHEQVTQRWHHALTNEAQGEMAREYLSRRRVSDEAVRAFRLGYAPDDWEDTVHWAKSRGFELAHLEQAGLILRREGKEGYYGRFRGRLMFPINDDQGRVIGFSGRILREEKAAAKYVNSPETPLFTKSRVIYGLDKAKRALLDEQMAVVCEGQLDLIAAHQAGITNVVAPQGTALTAQQARILKRYVEEVVLCFDADAAGQKAAVRALDDLLASGLAIRVATIPAPHDPDSYLREMGAEAFRRLIKEAPSFFEFYLQYLCGLHDITTDRGKSAVVKAMAEAVHKPRDPVLTDTYAQKTAQRLAVSPEAVRSAFRRTDHGRAREPGAEVPEPAPPSHEERPKPQEFWLLKLLLLDEELAADAAAHLDLQWISHRCVRRILEERIKAHEAQAWHGLPGLFASLEGDLPAQTLCAEAASDTREIPHRPQQLRDCLVALRNEHLDRRLATIMQRLSDPNQSEADREAIWRERLELARQKKAPLQPVKPS